MTLVTTLTQKGQVTIPQFIREELGLIPFQKISFVLENNRAYLQPSVSFLDLGGSIKTKTSFSVVRQKKAAKNFVSKRYGQSR